MEVELPSFYSDKNFEVISDRLYVSKKISFERPMYELSYALYIELFGELSCYLCERMLSKETATIDHVFPRSLGGISITDNLMPCCRHCNSKKSNIVLDEYLLVPRKRTKKFWNNFLNEVNSNNLRAFKTTGHRLPAEWVEEVDVSLIRDRKKKNDTSNRYLKYMEFYLTYLNFPIPVVLDRDFKVLDYSAIYHMAVSLGLDTVPAVYLENVILEDSLQSPRRAIKKAKNYH